VSRAPREVRAGPGLVFPASCLDIRFSRSGGPGGQNVNKVETKAEVRLDLATAPGLDDAKRARLLARLASRLVQGTVLAVACDRTRHRERNLGEALDRMGEILRAGLHVPRPRRPTRPTRGSRERRLGEKRARGEVKAARRVRPPREE
jgi:ribosome-associated protein